MTLNLQIALNPLRPVTPRTEGLITSALRPFPAAATASERANDDRWMLGVRWFPWPTVMTERAIEECSPVTLSDEIDAGDQITFDAFRVTASITCSVLTYSFDEVRQILITDADLYAAPAVAKHLMTATGGTGNFVDDAVILTGQVPSVRAVAAMEDKLNDVLQGALGVVYMPSVVSSEAYFALDDDDDGDEGPTGIATIVGHSVVVDPAFLGHPAAGATGADDAWVYGSGPIWGAVSAPHIDAADWESIDFTSNTATLRAQFEAIVVYDPSTVYAQKVCLSVCP